MSTEVIVMVTAFTWMLFGLAVGMGWREREMRRLERQLHEAHVQLKWHRSMR